MGGRCLVCYCSQATKLTVILFALLIFTLLHQTWYMVHHNSRITEYEWLTYSCNKTLQNMLLGVCAFKDENNMKICGGFFSPSVREKKSCWMTPMNKQIILSRYALESERFCQCHSLVTEVVKSFKDLIKKQPNKRHSSFKKAFPWHKTSKYFQVFKSKRNHKTILTFRHILCVCVYVSWYARQIPRGCVCVWVSSFTHSFSQCTRHRINDRGQSCCPIKKKLRHHY